MSSNPLQQEKLRGKIHRFFDSDLFYSFSRSPVIVISAIVTIAYMLIAGLAPWVAPHNPFDASSLILMDGFKPPFWETGGNTTYLLGTDDQGRDILSTIVHGSRISLIVGFCAVILSIIIGVGFGMIAGYFGGWADILIMRVTDIKLAIPGILIALMIDGVARSVLPTDMRENLAIYVLIFSIGFSQWPKYARVTRGATMVESNKDYIAAAQVIGVSSSSILVKHILPNVMGPVLVIGTIGLALAIITEATLSFLGVGMPPTTPSLGTLIRVGNNFLFSGEWWITFFPLIALVILVLAVNLLGDWLRDALNPKLR